MADMDSDYSTEHLANNLWYISEVYKESINVGGDQIAILSDTICSSLILN